MKDINGLQRENIKDLQPYASARSEFNGTEGIFLDANENSFGSPVEASYNRYPDPTQMALKTAISKVKGVPENHIFLGNGSDEAIDLLIRAFCTPGTDNIIISPPTFGLYEIFATIQDAGVKKAPLTEDFQLDMEAIAEAVDKNTKIIFVCSPNNPTGNTINRQDIETLLINFDGLVVVDEAYINYSRQHSFIKELTEYENLVVLQTFSKAWGMAGIRLGMAFASTPVINILNKIKAPYNLNQRTQELAIEALNNIEVVNEWIKTTVTEREKLVNELTQLSIIEKIFPSEANFLLVKVKNAEDIYKSLLNNGIITRKQLHIKDGCLRITVGTPTENSELLRVLQTL